MFHVKHFLLHTILINRLGQFCQAVYLVLHPQGGQLLSERTGQVNSISCELLQRQGWIRLRQGRHLHSALLHAHKHPLPGSPSVSQRPFSDCPVLSGNLFVRAVCLLTEAALPDGVERPNFSFGRECEP